jgi:hypothetical protein
VPNLGYADELVIVPLGILLTIQLIPAELLEEHRREARAMAERPTSRAAAIVIASAWVFAALAVSLWFASRFMH